MKLNKNKLKEYISTKMKLEILKNSNLYKTNLKEYIFESIILQNKLKTLNF